MGIAWCKDKMTTLIPFNKFTLEMKSDVTMYQKVQNNDDINEAISNIYIPTNTSWTNKDSLIIGEVELDKQLLLSTFVSQNREKINREIPWYEKYKSKWITINCADKKIQGQLESITIKRNTGNNYLSQYFFIDNSTWYAISFFSENKDETNNFINSLKNITCN